MDATKMNIYTFYWMSKQNQPVVGHSPLPLSACYHYYDAIKQKPLLIFFMKEGVTFL